MQRNTDSCKRHRGSFAQPNVHECTVPPVVIDLQNGHTSTLTMFQFLIMSLWYRGDMHIQRASAHDWWDLIKDDADEGR